MFLINWLRGLKNLFLVGYSNEKKGYKLFSLDNSSFFFSRGVKFYEDVFPYKMKKYIGGINQNSNVFYMTNELNTRHFVSNDYFFKTSCISYTLAHDEYGFSNQSEGTSVAICSELAGPSSQGGKVLSPHSMEVMPDPYSVSEETSNSEFEPSGSVSCWVFYA